MKKSFTIIELVVVMVILSLMLLMGRNLFTSENKIYFQGETCINNMYNQIDDLHLASLLSRERFLTGGSSSALNIINPEWIGILFRFPALYVGGGTIGTGIDIRGVPSLGNIRSQGS